jgi:hypothetical protein
VGRQFCLQQQVKLDVFAYAYEVTCCEETVFTAINSTEGADQRFPFSEIFVPCQRIVHISLSSTPIDLKPR